MNKPFLLIAGDYYYPGSGTSDWIGRYETEEDIPKIGKRDSEYQEITIEGHGNFDWYSIVDLRNMDGALE